MYPRTWRRFCAGFNRDGNKIRGEHVNRSFVGPQGTRRSYYPDDHHIDGAAGLNMVVDRTPAGGRVLIVKLSSLGDVLHTLPAVTDAAAAIPGLCFDWVVEEDLAEIPGWHPAVDRVIVLPHRRWRKNFPRVLFGGEWAGFLQALRSRSYDRVIDGQGLLAKSAWVAGLARGPSAGLDWHSAREPLASLCYRTRLRIPKDQHAVERLRQLFAGALAYPRPATMGDYGIRRDRFGAQVDGRKLVFLHGTTWATKLWSEDYWSALIGLAGAAGYRVSLTWGNEDERRRCDRLAQGRGEVVVLERMALGAIARELATARAMVTLDTGLGHLGAALGVPGVALYGPTSTMRTGTWGVDQRRLAAEFPCAPCLSRHCTYTGPRTVDPPCFEAMTPERVWGELRSLLREG